MDFPTAHARYYRDIQTVSRRQVVPDMDADDIAQEMHLCLWKACDTWDGKSDFGVYWWSLWLNKRSDLTRKANALKRPRTVNATVPERPVDDRLPLQAPKGAGPLERLIWGLLAGGETAREAMRLGEMSKRTYYALIQDWRTDSVRESLRD